MYCDQEHLSSPSGDCEMGYYCPTGQVTATPADFTCPLAHYCLTGAAEPSPCPSGSYQVFSCIIHYPSLMRRADGWVNRVIIFVLLLGHNWTVVL